MIPTITVGLVYTFIKELPISNFFTNSSHLGYWFCLTLLMYHIFNFLMFRIITVLKISQPEYRCILLWGGTVALLFVSRIFPYDNILTHALSLQAFFKYLPFFTYGVTFNLIPKLKEKVENNNYIYSVSLTLLFILTYCALSNTIGQIIIAFCYVNVMVFFFYKLCKGRSSKKVCYVAHRTLDIYLFHYFLLPSFILEIPSAFNPDTNILYTLITVILLSLAVLLGTLALTSFIERSRFLAYLTLGKIIDK